MTTRILIDANGRKHISNEPLLHPPKREWVGLTDDDQETIMEWLGHDVSSQVFYAIEAKLKEKNT